MGMSLLKRDCEMCAAPILYNNISYNPTNPFLTDRLFHPAGYNKVGMVHCILKGYRFEFSNCFIFHTPIIVFIQINSADPNEMPQTAASDLSLNCLPMDLFAL